MEDSNINENYFFPSVDSEDSEDSNKPCVMYTNSDNFVIMIGYETDEIIEKLLYQQGLKEKKTCGKNNQLRKKRNDY